MRLRKLHCSTHSGSVSPGVPPCPPWVSFLVLLLIFMASTACSKGSSSTPTPSPVAAAGDPTPEPAPAPDSGPLPQIDSRRAFQYIKDIVALGTRPIGSENHKKVENYITSHLKGDQVEDDAFIADTVEGKFPVRNIIAKFPGTKDGIIVIMSHYDTNYPLRNAGFVGANDGGSSSAILLEYANHLRGKKREGYSVWLVWTDGEEAVRQWSPTDSLYGTRHLAERWEKDGTLKKIKAVVLMDMIGDADLNILRDTNSTPWLTDLMHTAAERLGVQSHFYSLEGAVEDDHLPFVKRGVPSLDVIDLEYGYNNVFHHTPQDTLDKLSPRSLEIVGNSTLELLRMLDQR
jgi:glutaminyl-peptide cyclotransferase